MAAQSVRAQVNGPPEALLIANAGIIAVDNSR
jgi:hypothetical protein